MPVNTAKVQGRRKLDYQSLAEAVADAERLCAVPVRALGNWSAGQVFSHLALTCTHSIDGFTMTFPWYMRLMAKIFKKRILAGSMPAGFKLSPEGARILLPPETSIQEGLVDFRAAVARLQREPQRARHPMLGDLTREEWDRVHVQHARLHMSFLVPQ
jgi:Protein of unknown function (DUF1569)